MGDSEAGGGAKATKGSHSGYAVERTFDFVYLLIAVGLGIGLFLVFWPLLVGAVVLLSPVFLFFYLRSRIRRSPGGGEQVGGRKVAGVPSHGENPGENAIGAPIGRGYWLSGQPLYSSLCSKCGQQTFVFNQALHNCVKCGSDLGDRRDAVVKRPDGLFEVVSEQTSSRA